MGEIVRDDDSDVMTECLSRTGINFYIQTSLILLYTPYLYVIHPEDACLLPD